MLTIHAISTPHDQREVFSGFDPSSGTWIVSDLKSKLDLNRQLLAGRVFLPGDSVLRASDLWKTLLSRLRPDLQLVSSEFAITLIAQRLSTSGLDWVQAPGAAQAAYEYLTQLMPVLAHPNGEEMMSEWFAANPSSRERWGRWFDLSLTLWRHFLDEGFIAPAWAAGVLANEPGLAEAWTRPLVVDLGAELDQVEADLLSQLSERVDVMVLQPKPAWESEYRKALIAYEVFNQKVGAKRTTHASRTSQAPRTTYKKYTTMIAEVKDAVAKTREWLESGAAEASQIAIAAPDIEAYWPALSSYLDVEGISAQKDRVRRTHSYPDVARWLATLRLRTGSHRESDIELAVFDSRAEAPKLIGYERFKTLYSMIYGREDFERSSQVAERFSIELDPSDEASRDDFIAWSMRNLPEVVDLPRVEAVFKKLFAECPMALRLSVKRWLAYLEQLAAKTECRVRDGDPDGIACLGLSSAENSPATHLIVLGLTESSLRPNGRTAILFSDILSLAAGFGFHLSNDDQGCDEFEARWLLEDSSRELVIAVPETDFSGAAQAPSWLWMRGARAQGQHEKLDVPRPTRWDELQTSSLAAIAREKSWAEAQVAYLERSLQEDLGEAVPEPFGQELVETLSPSAIEDYLECPFVFAAKRMFSLSDVAELDLEVDASRRGSLMHKIFELLTGEPMRFDHSPDELGTVVDKAREASGLELADLRLWPPLRARYTDIARRFLEFEREHRARFAQTKTIAREADIAGHLRADTGELVRERTPGSLKFVGRIDRIDSDTKGNLAIYDYKSSASNVSQYTSWLKNNKIQLLLYAMAVEKGLSVFDPRPVLAALYYVSRPLSREYGFKVEDAEQGLFDTDDKRKRNRVTLAEKERLFGEGRLRVRDAIQGIMSGVFAPNPRDRKKCTECQWSYVCRAPHLSS